MRYLWILPFISFFSGYLVMHYVHLRPYIKMPALLGKNIQEAVELLSDQDLYVRIIAQKESNELPTGTIISQTPPPNSSVKAQQTVLLVAAKKKQILMPNYVYKNRADIAISAQEQALRYTTYPICHALTSNQCVGQWPLPGTPLNSNSNLIIYYADKTVKPLLMPNFKGLSITHVQQFLEAADIKPTVFYSTSGRTNKSDIITDQRPLPGSFILLDPKPTIQLQVES